MWLAFYQSFSEIYGFLREYLKNLQEISKMWNFTFKNSIIWALIVHNFAQSQPIDKILSVLDLSNHSKQLSTIDYGSKKITRAAVHAEIWEL